MTCVAYFRFFAASCISAKNSLTSASLTTFPSCANGRKNLTRSSLLPPPKVSEEHGRFLQNLLQFIERMDALYRLIPWQPRQGPHAQLLQR